jgi:hydrogenase expression/formation protein HypE
VTLRPGKLPPEILADLLRKLRRRDPRVLLGPAIGRDAAVLDLGDGRALVATMDPVTFAEEHIGWYAVNVNANDIACMGARPAWFLATALLPVGAPDALPARIFDELSRACEQLEIELIGGHTEVTGGIDHAIVVGAMLGEAAHNEIVSGENIRPGDCVLLTKRIAIEGTALLARDSPDILKQRGVTTQTIDRAAAMLFAPGISVVEDARAICRATRPRLMHDATEGGVATALHEMAAAAALTLSIDLAAIAVYDETREICHALELDPRGLLASGALLAIVDAGDYTAVADALARAKIDCQVIGRVGSGAARVIIDGEDSSAPLLAFDRDELARFYDASGGGNSTIGRLEGS